MVYRIIDKNDMISLSFPDSVEMKIGNTNFSDKIIWDNLYTYDSNDGTYNLYNKVDETTFRANINKQVIRILNDNSIISELYDITNDPTILFSNTYRTTFIGNYYQVVVVDYDDNYFNYDTTDNYVQILLPFCINITGKTKTEVDALIESSINYYYS